jgi:hypothetical protein
MKTRGKKKRFISSSVALGLLGNWEIGDSGAVEKVLNSLRSF